MVKVHNFAKKGSQIQKQAAAIHSNSKKTGKKLNKAIKKTARKLRRTTKQANNQRQKKKKQRTPTDDYQRQQCDPRSRLERLVSEYGVDANILNVSASIRRKVSLYIEKYESDYFERHHDEKKFEEERKCSIRAKKISSKLRKIEQQHAEKKINVNKVGCAFCQGFHTLSDCPTLGIIDYNIFRSKKNKRERISYIIKVIDEPPEYIDYSILRNQKGKNKIKGGNPQGKQNKTKASTINSTNYAHGSVPVFDFNCL